MMLGRISATVALAAVLCVSAVGCAGTSNASSSATEGGAPSATSADSTQTLKEACDALNSAPGLGTSIPELSASITSFQEAVANNGDTQTAGDKVTAAAQATAKGYQDAGVTNGDLKPLVSSYVASLNDLAGARTVDDYNKALAAMKETATAMKAKCDAA